jgi:membrane protease YdiL (CAAX protease family)
MNDAPSYAMNLAIGLAVTISLATLFRLFQKHIDGRPLLEYEPRRPAPWNALAPLVMLAPLLLALWSALRSEPHVDPVEQITAFTACATASAAGAPPVASFGAQSIGARLPELARRMANVEWMAGPIWVQSAMTILLAACCYVLLAVAFAATGMDLGLPCNWSQFRRDVRIGATAWAASLVPIYTILLVLNVVFQPTEGHPLIESLLADHSLHMMTAAAFAAIVAAPIYEETAFRLALQGWLERRAMLAGDVVAFDVQPPEALAVVGVIHLDSTAQAAPLQPQGVTYSYPPPGWAPIAISSVLFGLAHIGHGVAPTPLILLGVVLGYVYRQTHRITPCIVCHLLFNAFTFVLLTLEFARAE